MIVDVTRSCLVGRVNDDGSASGRTGLSWPDFNSGQADDGYKFFGNAQSLCKITLRSSG